MNVAGLSVVLALTATATALARPGGGLGGGSGDAGGLAGSAEGGDFSGLFDLLFRLIVRYPVLGVPVAILVGFVIYKLIHSQESGDWEVRGARLGKEAEPAPADPAPAKTTPAATAGEPDRPLRPPLLPVGALESNGLRGHDPDFSLVLFEDFANRLYVALHQARSDPDALAVLGPYHSPAARAHLAQRAPVGGRVRAVVVGSLKRAGLAVQPQLGQQPGQTRLSVSYESNIHVDDASGAAVQSVVETWHFARRETARTKPWKGARVFGCPNCAAPLPGSGARCASCGEDMEPGRFDWCVEQIDLTSVTAAPPTLAGRGPQAGNDLPTVVDSSMKDTWRLLAGDDPTLTDESLGARLALIHQELQASWSTRDPSRVRPFVMDSLFEYLRFWIEAYKEQGLRNVIEEPVMERLERTKVVRDRQFDAITFRLFARSRSYTVDVATNRVIGGDPARERRYSEYWTLVRGAMVRRAPRAEKVCPGCAAPLDVDGTGNCAHCGNRVTTGEFDWVLFKIEPDETYRPLRGSVP